ncbi:MAG: hypothetical protein V1837_05055 [Candidatus Woesearchaeota archaeon]
MKKTPVSKKTEKPKVAFKRFRCEMCGATSDKPGEHCGYPMVDLLSTGCMGCQGCGMHVK